MKKLFLYTALASLFTACAPKTYESLQSGESKVNLAWESLACRGKCPQYQASIFQNSLQFTGIRNTQFIGDTIIANWAGSEQELINRLAQMDVLALDSVYKFAHSSYDGPAYRYFMQIHGGQGFNQIIDTKKIETFGSAPESLNSLQKWLDQQLLDAGLL